MIEQFRVVLAASAGALVGLGCVLFAVGLPSPGPPDDRARLGGVGSRSRRPSAGGGCFSAGVLTGVLVLVLTQWVVLAVGLGLLVGFWDRVFGGVRHERAAISRIEGLATWIESVRDTIAGAVGLEQAIPATAINAAPSIRPALNLLVDRVRVREPLPNALLKFADDLDDASADLVVAALILNARLRGPGLRDVLSALAVSARDELDVRRRVESSRRSTRRSVQIVVGVILAGRGSAGRLQPCVRRALRHPSRSGRARGGADDVRGERAVAAPALRGGGARAVPPRSSSTERSP